MIISVMTHVRREFDLMRHHVNAIIHDLDRDQLLWTPPGRTNRIGTTLLHILTGEDRLIHDVLQGRPWLCAYGDWQAQMGISALPIRGHEWTDVDLTMLQLAPLWAYAQAVAEATTAYLALLSDEDLEDQVEVYGQPQSRAQALLSVVIHNVSHAGEIAALKGLQGMPGRPT
jgi:uncharacterized damage-inducible protein DinB